MTWVKLLWDLLSLIASAIMIVFSITAHMKYSRPRCTRAVGSLREWRCRGRASRMCVDDLCAECCSDIHQLKCGEHGSLGLHQ